VILAVDGGNSKTDVALVARDGELLAHARGPLSSPHHVGLDGCLGVLAQLVDDVGLDGSRADVAQVLLAGIDLPEEEDALRRAVEERRWAESTYVGNDTFAVLRAGTDAGWGVAITCGAGINCVGVGPDGSRARFLALGDLSGDFGGGHGIGVAALGAAVRSEDGRGPQTLLEQLVPAHFRVDTPSAVARAVHFGAIDHRRLADLAPVVSEAAEHDGVAASIVTRQVEEIVALARAAVTRLGLLDRDVEIVVGGGMMRAADDALLARIQDGLHEVGPGLTLRRTTTPPIVGAALLALDVVGASDDARARLRSELAAAVAQHEQKEVA
jgi:N-acetylglucosamine kinase-like BadF-type ATPase